MNIVILKRFPFSLLSIKVESKAYKITMLSVCPQLINFELIGRVSRNSAERSFHCNRSWAYLQDLFESLFCFMKIYIWDGVKF
jgi:hypothetical protein